MVLWTCDLLLPAGCLDANRGILEALTTSVAGRCLFIYKHYRIC